MWGGFWGCVWLGFPVSRGVLQYGFVGFGGDLGVFGGGGCVCVCQVGVFGFVGFFRVGDDLILLVRFGVDW